VHCKVVLAMVTGQWL